MDRLRDSIAAVVRSRHGPAGGVKFTAWRAPELFDAFPRSCAILRKES